MRGRLGRGWFEALALTTAIGCSPVVTDDAAAASGAGGAPHGSGPGATGGAGGGSTATAITTSGIGGSSSDSVGSATAAGSGAASSSSSDAASSSTVSAASSSSSSGAGGSAACPPLDQPELLATTPMTADQLAIDDAYAYWPDEFIGKIFRVSFCTHEVTELVTGEINPVAIAVDGDSLVWGTAHDHGELRIAPLAGGTPKSLWAGGQVESLALDGDRIYFAAWTGNGVTHDMPGVYAVDKDGSNLLQLYAGSTERPIGIDATNVYFSPNTGARRLVKVPKTGGPPDVVAPLQVVGAFAASATELYAATWQGGMQNANLVGFPFDGSAPYVFAGDFSDVTTGVTLTSDLVIWTSQSGNALMAAPLGGGMPATFVGSLHGPQRVVSRNGVLAWTTYQDKSLWRMRAL